MRRAGYSLLLLVGFGGLLPLGAHYWWGFELLSHFRIQYVAVAGVSIAVSLAGRAWLAVALLTVAASINVLPVIAYLPTAVEPAAAPAGARFDILNLNVNSSNRNHAGILDAIRSSNADVVTLLEVTPKLETALELLAEEYPHRETLPAEGNFGIALLSRHPLVDVAYFSTGETTGIDAGIRLPSGPIRVLAVHLLPPMGRRLAAARNRGLDMLASHAYGIDDPLVICGDFNLTPYSPFFADLIRAADLRDTRVGQGIDISWPTTFPLAGIPIDHCLLRGRLAVESVSRMDPIGSDHYPVKVSLIREGNP